MHQKLTACLSPEEFEAFFATALKVVDFETSNVVSFKITPIQREFLYNFEDNNIILKARRHGISTVILGMAFANCLYFKNYKAAFIAHSKDDAREIFKKVHFFLKHLPPELNIKTDSETKDIISILNTGSQITVSTAGTKGAKSGSDLNFVHFSEVAKFEVFDVLTSAREALLKGGLTFYESTACGMNHFYDLWEKAQGFNQKPKTSYIKPFFFSSVQHLSYRKDPDEGFELNTEEKAQVENAKEYGIIATDQEWSKHFCWRRWKIDTMDDPDLLVQEHPLVPQDAFISTGRPVFNLDALWRMKNVSADYRIGEIEVDSKHNYRFYHEKNGYLTFFKDPMIGNQYIIGADVGEGKDKGTFSVGSVWNCANGEQVAEFHGLLDEDQFAYHLNMLGKFYNTALIAVEIPGPGYQVVSILNNSYNYPNLYSEISEEEDLTQEVTGAYGWRNNNKTRTAAIALAKRAIRLGLIKINSVNCIRECETFITTKTGKIKAENGKYDDRVLAMMIAVYIMNQLPELGHKYFPTADESKYYNFVQKPKESHIRKKSGY